MYAGCMNTSLRDRKGIFPIRNILKGWPTKYNDWNSASKITASDWQKMANLVADYGVQFIFKLTIRADVLNATRTSVYVCTSFFMFLFSQLFLVPSSNFVIHIIFVRSRATTSRCQPRCCKDPYIFWNMTFPVEWIPSLRYI